MTVPTAYDSFNRLIRETDQETAQVNYTLNGQDKENQGQYTDFLAYAHRQSQPRPSPGQAIPASPMR